MSLVYHDFFDDILTEIFLRLPAKSLFRLKCLSKNWNRILSTFSFRSKYVSIRTDTTSTLKKPLGFFLAWTPPRRSPHLPNVIYFQFSTNFKTMFLVGDSVVDMKLMFGMFMAESNGIILYGNHYNYYLCDPITGRTVMLPQPRNKGYEGVGFYYEEVSDKETGCVLANFKVIRPTGRKSSNMLTIETYLSDEMAWEESILHACVPFEIDLGYPTRAMHGIFYWIAMTNAIVVYDPSHANCSNWMWLLDIPPSEGQKNYVLGESEEDRNLLLGMDNYPCFRVLKLAKSVHSYSRHEMVSHLEWTSLYFISYPPLPSLSLDRIDPQHIYPHLVTFHPHCSRYILIKRSSRACWMNLASQEVYHERYFVEVFLLGHGQFVPYFSVSWPPTLP